MKTGATYDGVRYQCDAHPDGTVENFRVVERTWNAYFPDGTPDTAQGIKNTNTTPLPDVRSWGDIAQKHGRDVVRCHECGELDETEAWPATIADQMRNYELCWSCWHWISRIVEPIETAARTRPFFVVDGHFFSLGTEPSESRIKSGRLSHCGFSGRRFEFTDTTTGETTVSHNVWHGGIVPQHLRHRLPDNAKFTNP